MLAGYPWFKCRARDLFISLPGLTLALGEQDEFEDVMKTAEKAIREFINGEPSSYKNIRRWSIRMMLLWLSWLYSSMPRRLRVKLPADVR